MDSIIAILNVIACFDLGLPRCAGKQLLVLQIYIGTRTLNITGPLGQAFYPVVGSIASDAQDFAVLRSWFFLRQKHEGFGKLR